MTTIRYHEAIRLGAMFGPQAFGDSYGPNGALCANVGAGKAVGNLHGRTWHVFPFAAVTDIPCPECGVNEHLLASIVAVHLNDMHRWTRNQIADFIEPLEEKWWAERTIVLAPSVEVSA